MTSNHILGLPRNNSAQGLSLPRRLYRWPPLGLKVRITLILDPTPPVALLEPYRMLSPVYSN